MRPLLLSTTYLGPVEWYARLEAAPAAAIEQHEHYVKQTWRNRCRIAMPDGPCDLVVPVAGASSHTPLRDLRVSDHGNWRHHHWNAMQTAYGKTPFFEYYADLFAPFYEQPATFLLDLNERLRQLMCTLIGIDTPVALTEHFAPPAETPCTLSHDDPAPTCAAPCTDMRYTMHPDSLPTATLPPYYQVHAQRHGFIPNLSIVDLLFNMGPESLLVLRQAEPTDIATT